MAPNVTEKNGAVTITVRGRHTSMDLEDAETFLEDLEDAIEVARAKALDLNSTR